MYEQDRRGQDPSGGENNRPVRSPEARARAKARAQARARARRLARIRMILYVLVFAVAVFVLAIVIRSGKDNTEDTQPQEGKSDVSFLAEDAGHISMRRTCGCQVDAATLLTEPLDWDLTAENAKVLILHSHISESYTKTADQDYTESEPYRTDNNAYNVAAVGDRLAQLLRDGGVEVIHDTTDFEVPNTDYSYDSARDSLEQYLRNDPDIVLVIDLHRDSALAEDGSQWGPTVDVKGRETARIAFAVGTGCYIGGENHWEDNFSVTAKIQVQLEKLYPGITRDILVSSSQYNQDLPARFMLVEVGTAGNTLEEAVGAADCLAEAILSISAGTAE